MLIIGAGIIGGVYILFLISFCFWFVYLLQLIIQKRNSYRASVRNLELSITSQNTSYQIKTDLVKNVFLFVMNIIELISLTFAVVPSTIATTFPQSNNISSSMSNETFYHKLKSYYLLKGEGFLTVFNEKVILYTNTLSINLFDLSISILTSLCIYLSARYAQKSWIKSTSIRYYLGITVVLIVIFQVCTFISCVFSTIMRLFHCLFEVILFVLMIKHSRRLKMVVNWTIVDLKISKTNKRLLFRLQRKQKSFVKFLHLLWIGIFLIVLSDTSSTTVFVVLTDWNSIQADKSPLNRCVKQNNHIAAYVTAPIFSASDLLFIIGITLILTPYIGIGLYTMVIVLWRCGNGKTGYRTKFRNPLLK